MKSFLLVTTEFKSKFYVKNGRITKSDHAFLKRFNGEPVKQLFDWLDDSYDDYFVNSLDRNIEVENINDI